MARWSHRRNVNANPRLAIHMRRITSRAVPPSTIVFFQYSGLFLMYGMNTGTTPSSALCGDREEGFDSALLLATKATITNHFWSNI